MIAAAVEHLKHGSTILIKPFYDITDITTDTNTSIIISEMIILTQFIFLVQERLKVKMEREMYSSLVVRGETKKLLAANFT
jgi:hypothetical protein